MFKTYILVLIYIVIPILMVCSYCSADCGVYAIKFLEFNMTNTPMDNLNDKTLIDFRERLAVECFHGEMDPCVVSEAA